MTDAGYYRGTTADQDTRFGDKTKKLMKTLKFSDQLNEPVDMRKVFFILKRPRLASPLAHSHPALTLPPPYPCVTLTLALPYPHLTPVFR